MNIQKKLCPPGLKNNPNKKLTAINNITIHCTGNYSVSANASSHANYVHGGSGGKQASWHYSIDGKEIWQHFEDNQACWHAGESTGNNTSIGLEICVNDKAVFRKACENAAWLTAELLKRHKLTLDRVVQHNRWSGKNCPAELRNGTWGVTWAEFLEMVRKNGIT
jgi:N-acetylmuramoyl-L-alanine amidase